jgi:hypothetical protein
MTPRETYALIDAASWQIEQDHKRDAWLAWHTAALMRKKRMPKLKELQGGGKTKVLEGEELQRRRSEKREMLANLDLDKLNEAMRKKVSENGS